MPDRIHRVRELFQQTIDLGSDDRSGFLDRACGDDAALREEIDGLLAALGDATEFLTETRASTEEQAGAVFDRYRLVEPLGEGGFGVVWRAEQEAPLQCDVALKVIKLGMDTRQIVKRFDAERRVPQLLPVGRRALSARTAEVG